MCEVEIKANLTNQEYTHLRHILPEIGTYHGRFIQRDCYFQERHSPIERVRVRSVDSSNNVIITFKNRRSYDGIETNQEIEFKADDGNNVRTFFKALGLTESFSKTKIVELFSYEKMSYELVEIEGLGFFIEIETILPSFCDFMSVAQAREDVLEALLALGITPASIEKKTYKELLGFSMDKNFH
jgi:adenylate cyclase class 2